MPSSTSRPASYEGGRLARLWLGFLAGPVVFLIVLEANYVLAYVACEQRQKWMIQVPEAIGVVLLALAAYGAWGAAAGRGAVDGPTSDPIATASLRNRFMAYGAVVLCAGFILAILSMEIPALLLGPCQ